MHDRQVVSFLRLLSYLLLTAAASKRGIYMENTHVRLIYKDLTKGAQVPKLVSFFQKELTLPKEKIRNLLTNPPHVLWEFSALSDAEIIQGALRKLGCVTLLEHVSLYPSFPFAVSLEHEKAIRREFSKILRSKTSLALFVTHVESSDSRTYIPSMLGSLGEKLAGHFRSSDTVIGLDDSRVLILCFATDKQGIDHIQSKTALVLREILGSQVSISTGFALFPDEAQSLQQLLQLAEMKRRDKPENMQKKQPASSSSPVVATAAGETKKPSALQLCFTKAQGKIFERLTRMDAPTLWTGLSMIPQTKQKEFLARLPFDSPLVRPLEEMISTQPEQQTDKSAEQHFEAIMHQMELEEGIRERETTGEEILGQMKTVDALPTLPAIASEIFAITSDPLSSSARLTGLIKNDPSLTSKLLKTVNSAFYGSMQKISTIQQAVVILGMDEITDIAFGLAAARVFTVKPYEGLLHPKALWHHSMCTALITQHLCKKIPRFQDIGAFTAGLLHDVGKIFLLANFPGQYKAGFSTSLESSLPLVEAEEDLLGISHATIGKSLAIHWNLPEPLIQAVAFHHQPFSAASHGDLAAVVGLADYLYYTARQAEKNNNEPAAPPRLTYGHWSLLTHLFESLQHGRLLEMQGEASAIIRQNSAGLPALQ